MQLAILGGAPVVARPDLPWPRWPIASSSLLGRIQQVLNSGRWTITGASPIGDAVEEQFAEAFARYNGVPYCVPTVNGTTALRLILQAYGIGPGDEVILPGLTWVACATAVTDVGAVPIFADIDATSACLCANSVRSAITARTAVIMVVHLYCNVVDLGAMRQICQRHNLVLIEDCAQSHGAEWDGRKVGSLGHAGAFSMHQGKPLTCGEGGAAITADPGIYQRLRQLSNNGRSQISSAPSVGHRPGERAGSIQGTNAVMSEIQAAILLDGLEQLPEQIDRKAINIDRLDRGLCEIPGCRVLVPSSPSVTRRSPYHYLIRFDTGEFAGKSLESIANALEAELGFAFNRTYPPLNVHPLYQPQTLTTARRIREYAAAVQNARSVELPNAQSMYDQSLIFRHSVLLAAPEQIDKIVQAVAKVQKLAKSIPDAP